MSATTWVVQHGLMTAADPATLPFRYAEPMYDVLTVGPQHVDVRIEQLLRHAAGLDGHEQLLGEDVVLLTARVPLVIAPALADQDDAHRTGERTMWERLRHLSEDRPAKHPRDVSDDDERTPLVQLDLQGVIEMRFARVRRTRLGDQVLAGRDALEVRAFDRWIGGRFLTRDRVVRHGLRRI